ncbi:hypothetical protein CFter6_3022 [Collimonas fungivorans]|uniref:Uncharacterized protein n=1 Tax=Collimonas fungivorans TaxID=158899 RepID=A0A127PCX8_9BURK|nr:hypothetical protein CFter6_3022 [Collimonas fungivorans]
MAKLSVATGIMHQSISLRYSFVGIFAWKHIKCHSAIAAKT